MKRKQNNEQTKKNSFGLKQSGRNNEVVILTVFMQQMLMSSETINV